MQLDRLHEQAITRQLSHDEMFQLQCAAHKRGSLLVWLDKDMTWLALHGSARRTFWMACGVEQTKQFCPALDRAERYSGEISTKDTLKDSEGGFSYLDLRRSHGWPDVQAPPKKANLNQGFLSGDGSRHGPGQKP